MSAKAPADHPRASVSERVTFPAPERRHCTELSRPLRVRGRPSKIPPMTFATGIIIWIAIGLGAAVLLRRVRRGPTTTLVLSLAFGVFGALIGGMLGVAGYIAHDPSPFRFGGLLGAILGGLLFSFVYHEVARKFV